VLVLGVTADDKGAQLESLVCRMLEEQGYSNVRPNVVGAGGNEVDISAERQATVIGGTQITPLMCEAKAYAGSVNMPTWQKFLGKLLIARTDDVTTVGLLIALNGVNGNVAGSLKAQTS
jgi:restriction endonuclease Mrr